MDMIRGTDIKKQRQNDIEAQQKAMAEKLNKRKKKRDSIMVVEDILDDLPEEAEKEA